MAKDKKVISLDERRRGTPRVRPPRAARPSAPRSEPGAAAGPDTGPTAGAPAGVAPMDSGPLPGRLIWLYCPTCRTIEYTELDMAGGRVHNACGTQVQEAPVELDLRAEATIARINLERLTILESLLSGQRQRYEEYLKRLNLAAGTNVQAYALSEEATGQLPVADVDAFGLLVSRFFHNPGVHFPELTAEPAPDPAPPAAPED
jgi:hypothetical protein